MSEIWKPIHKFRSHYRVSNKGRIQTIKTGRIRKVRPDRDGYAIVDLKRPGYNKTARVHRIVAAAFHKRLPGQNEVNHLKGDKMDARASKLEWVTHSQNMVHAHKEGLQGRHVTNGMSIIKAHLRKRKNGATKVRSHSRLNKLRK